MTLNFPLIFACAVLTLSPLPASAAASQDPAPQPAPDPTQAIQRADKNNDGIITREEVIAMRKDIFQRMDRNKDGYVSSDDTPPILQSRFERAFTQLRTQFDKDGDGRVSRSELMDAPMPAFALGDTNQDGQLDQEEIAALRARQADAPGR